jgi:adenylate cyclase
VLVGRYVDGLAADLRAQTGATISIYDPLGTLLASSNESAEAAGEPLSEAVVSELTSGEADQSPVRSLTIGGTPYGEVLTRFVARGGEDFLGFLGISLPEATVTAVGAGPDPSVVVALSALALLLVVVIGLLISNSITRPLVRMADASTAVATGNLETRVPEEGSDEITVLAGTFNRMVEGLREGLIYHDLLGRAVTPEVREELRRGLADGARAAGVQSTRATVLVAGLRGAIGRAVQDPTRTMTSLSEYFAALVPLVAHHGGVVYRFDGESAVALFGLLPRPSPAPVGALQAVHAAFELIDLVDRMNVRREEAGQRHLSLGVAVATGEVVAGGLGTRDRIQYTVIGDAVEAAVELERVLRETSAEGLLIDGGAYRALGGSRNHFEFGRQGQAQIRGRAAPQEIYEVIGRKRRLLEAGGANFFEDTTSPFGRGPAPADGGLQ